MDPLTILQLVMGIGSGIGGMFGPDPERRRQSDQIHALNATDELSEFFRQIGLGAFDPGRQGLVNQVDTPLNANQQSIFDTLNRITGQAGGVFDSIPGLFQGANQIVDPRTLGPQATEVFDAAQMDIQNRGNTAQLSNVEDRLNEFRDANRAALGPGLEAALGGILSGGNTAATDQMSAAMMDIINAGGRTPEIDQAFSTGQGLVDSGGLTPALREIMGTFQSQIQSGGLTPEARNVLAPLQAIIDAGGQGGAVQQTTEQMASLLQDAAATQHANAGEAARREALNRGGQAGTVVGSGAINSSLRDFQDQGVQGQAEALRQAVFGQQAARQANFNAATQGAGDILRNATALLASVNSGLGQVAGATSQNISTGAGLMSDANRTAAANLGAGIGGFNQNIANVNSNLAINGDIFGTLGALFNQSELGSAQGLLDVEGARRSQQNNAAAQLLGLGDQSLQARGQNQNSAANQISSLLSSLGLASNSATNAGNLATAGRGQQIGTASTLFQGGTNLLSNQTSLNGQRAQILTGGPPPGPTNLQRGLAGFASQIDVPGLLGSVFGSFGGGNNPGNGAIGG